MNNNTDQLFIDIAEYVCHQTIDSELAYDTARLCLLDALGCAALALQDEDCRRLLGPIVPGTVVPQGVHVMGTQFLLDPVKAAFDIGTMIRYLDYNDTFLAKEWGHPSDNLGAILSVADYVSQRGKSHLILHDILTLMIKAYEIQGVLALENAFNEVGLDHVILIKIASTALATFLLGATKQQVMDAISQAIVDGQSLRAYRHAGNTTARKSWAAGDATSRAVRLAMLTLNGEAGFPTALSAKKWGFNDVYLHGKPLVVNRSLGSYVMENILFKIMPSEFHAQTAIEAASRLYPSINKHIEAIDKIVIETQNPAMQIINKKGQLNNRADRDHCLQYIVAVVLLNGHITAESYSDAFAKQHQSAIDALRNKMVLVENAQMTKDYYDNDKRSIANSIEIFFNNGDTKVSRIDYPLGHVRRRKESLSLIYEKAHGNLSLHYPHDKVEKIISLFKDRERFDQVSLPDFLGLFQR